MEAMPAIIPRRLHRHVRGHHTRLGEKEPPEFVRLCTEVSRLVHSRDEVPAKSTTD
jgi:hypothetical protein